ncbi:SH2 domain containing 3Cb isoform X2 [Scophthalmus maximus]|uniref:SH2 domain containing 3Cb isoform X2 n=1 Tax=Scophthalmus maximus TaxID=52904 RepID=UPI001FA89D60|nr:SH2 domain containing 3Cb isoform X2 [Scophthalmus maximus]
MSKRKLNEIMCSGIRKTETADVVSRGLKWFGSFTNLSTRRPRSNGGIKDAPAQEHDGSIGGAKSAAAGGRSVDDAESSLRNPGYARSSDMYTHVGTVPRSEKTTRRSWRGVKEKKKSKREEEEGGVSGGGQSQGKAGEHVQDSPLLSALSSLSVTSLDRPAPVSAPARSLPDTPTPSWASPLTSAPDGRCCSRPPGNPAKIQGAPSRSGEASEPSDMTTNRVVSPQDVYVPMDPIAEAARDRQERAQEATDPANGSQEVASGERRRHVTGGGGEYVKFSRGKFCLEPPSDKQRKQLEEELKLSGTNLRSHGWYHGHIPWQVSESLVVKDGDFLIRDSQSSQGDFVLTSRWEQTTLHFLVRQTAVQSSDAYTRVQYSLEGECFDTLQALVHFYVGSRAVLTRWSGAQIHQPVNRMLPLSYLDTAFCTTVSPPSCHGEGTVRPRSPSSLHHREADLSRGRDNHSAGESSPSTPNSNNTPQPRSPCSGQAASVAPSPSLSRRSNTTQPTSSPNSGNNRSHPHQHQDSLSSDSDGSCYTELYPGPQSYVERLRVEEGSVAVDPLRLEDGTGFFSPMVEAVSSFRPSKYESRLMPLENKPLEVAILRRVKELLAEIDPRTAAKHITKADCMVARILEVTPEVQRMMGVSSGMELLTLPHGQQLRLDLLERFQTMAITLAVDVLGCTGTTEERASLLHKIIQIAAELKSTMGNMFGFAAVMRALELPQVSRLELTWMALRQRHTEGAILYEKTLRPFMKSLNSGRESCPLSTTTFPHVLPLLSLLEKSVAVGEGAEPWETVEVGVDVVMFHLGAARTIAQLGGIYRSNAESKLQGFQEHSEVLELFQTDFQLRLLWGSRGATENRALRYAKFDQVLTALSNKLEPPVRSR